MHAFSPNRFNEAATFRSWMQANFSTTNYTRRVFERQSRNLRKNLRAFRVSHQRLHTLIRGA